MSTEYTDVSSLSVKELLRLTLQETRDSILDELTARYTNLRELASATIAELTDINGLEPAKASALLACMELSRRLNAPPPGEPRVIRCPRDAANLVMEEMRYLDKEHFRVVLLNTKNYLLKLEIISIGTLNSSAVHPREVFKPAIKHSAAAIILVHNHPSGDPTPSNGDIEVTRRLSEAGKLLGIEILDHIVIGDGRFTSFKDKGLL